VHRLWRLRHKRQMEGAPGKVMTAEMHRGDQAMTRGNNDGVWRRLMAVGRLRRPVTFEEGRCAGLGSPDEATDGGFGFNSDDGGGAPIGRSGQEVEWARWCSWHQWKGEGGGGENRERW
jgi:hypothetical protein